MNTKIYIAPSRQKSSEVLAAEQMSFKFFSQICSWTARKSVERRAGCSKSPNQTPRSLADQRLSWYVARRVSRCQPTAAATCRQRTRRGYMRRPSRSLQWLHYWPMLPQVTTDYKPDLCR